MIAIEWVKASRATLFIAVVVMILAFSQELSSLAIYELRSVKNREVWRLFTGHLAHAGWLHAVFNLMLLVPFAAMPLDTALSAISLIRAGIPARYPKLRVGFSHGGGAIVPLVHRLAVGWKITQSFQGKVPEKPIEYARKFFYDSLVYDVDYLSYLAREFAPGQIFGGTDYPYPIMEKDLNGFLGSATVEDKYSLAQGAAERFLNIS